MAEGIMEVSDATFDAEVLKSDIPVLVDFWAPWCGPCKAIGPILEEVSKEYAGKVKFAKCNVDNSPVTPGNYGIRAIPTLILFKSGKQAEQIVGLADRNRIEQILNKNI
jgi:thioredoxin 1